LDSFSSIVVCIEYGRLVYDNLKKVIIYLLPAGTFCELWPILFPVLFGLPQPLSSIEMIIISMLTDCIASMSLIKEKPEADVLLRPPRRPSKDRLTNSKLLFQAYFITGVPMLVCTSAMAFRVFGQAGIPFSSLWMSFGKIVVNGVPVDPAFFQQELYRAQSTYFLTLVLMHYGTLFMIRTRRLSIIQQPPIGSKKTRNLYIFAAMLTTLSMMLLFILTPFFQSIFHTRSVLVEFWFIRISNPVLAANFSVRICGRARGVGRDQKVFRSSLPERISCQNRVVGMFYVFYVLCASVKFSVETLLGCVTCIDSTRCH
jgi:sodium/potassium-transporting ATPase subunit alpha